MIYPATSYRPGYALHGKAAAEFYRAQAAGLAWIRAEMAKRAKGE